MLLLKPKNKGKDMGSLFLKGMIAITILVMALLLLQSIFNKGAKPLQVIENVEHAKKPPKILATQNQPNASPEMDINARNEEQEKQEQEKLLSDVKAKMKDPDSIQFKDLKFGKVDNHPAVCGLVNGKNGFGGYTGFDGFYAGYSVDGSFTVFFQSDKDGIGSLAFPQFAKELGCI